MDPLFNPIPIVLYSKQVMLSMIKICIWYWKKSYRITKDIGWISKIYRLFMNLSKPTIWSKLNTLDLSLVVVVDPDSHVCQEPPGQVWCDCVTMQASWMWTWQTVAAKNAEQVAVCSNIFPSKSFLHSGVFEWLEEETRVSNPHLKYHHSYSRNIANNSRLVNPLVKQKLSLCGDY